MYSIVITTPDGVIKESFTTQEEALGSAVDYVKTKGQGEYEIKVEVDINEI